ncbi:ABC transporter ATP-binding protein [Desulfobacca acetoxidans]|uniref:ABC transporter ATP-binding protein n=1 Tax=Desulfobacca acetoxidans TaxID=60893 RepID=UPI0011D1B7FE
MPVLITLHNITKIYRPGAYQIYALQGISLGVPPGEFLAVMGPSGSGKSTLLHILGCMDQPTAGEYYLAGQMISNLSAKSLAKIRNKKIGMVFQSFFMLPRFTALDNVALPLMYADTNGKSEREMAGAALAKVGLADRAHHLPQQLSGGQQQRVSLARALVNNPELLLADEPTGNLDRETGFQIMKLLIQLNQSQGLSIVMVTHDLEMAAFADRRIVLRDGFIISES